MTGKTKDYKSAFRDETAIQATHDLLTLVEMEVPHAEIAKWTGNMRRKAEDFAAREHLHASGNPIMRVPCPAFLEKYKRAAKTQSR